MMTVERRDAILAGMQSTARKLYALIPNEPDTVKPFQINNLLESAGSPAMIMSGMEKVLLDLYDAGLIKAARKFGDKILTAELCRVPVKSAKDPKPKETVEVMKEPAKTEDALSRLISVAESLRSLASLVEEVALEAQKSLDESKSARAKLDALREALR